MPYTKGKWKFNMLNDIGVEGDSDPVCHIFRRVNEDEAEANAQLIAAAPKLYEALKKNVEHFRKLDKLYSKDLDMLELGEQALAEVKF